MSELWQFTTGIVSTNDGHNAYKSRLCYLRRRFVRGVNLHCTLCAPGGFLYLLSLYQDTNIKKNLISKK